jgi:hypothetical protein
MAFSLQQTYQKFINMYTQILKCKFPDVYDVIHYFLGAHEINA